jgi:high-affinity K+ transport system ATPase subunit B
VARVEPAILPRALLAALLKLDPRHLARSPVMFVVEIGSERFVG